VKVYFIRHGESEGNRQGIIQGWKDFPLSGLGKKQAQLVGQAVSALQFDRIYSSDLSRAYETALAIGEHQKAEIIKWDKIREITLGPLEGKPKKEILETYPEVQERGLLTSGVAGTETVEAITKRCQEIEKELFAKHQEGESVLLVCHGGLISIFLMYVLLGESWHQYHRPFVIGNTSVTMVEWKKGQQPMIHFINQTTHLQANDTIYQAIK